MSKPPRQKKGRKPASVRADLAALAQHRLFPAFVGLWCAALFGLGGMAASADALAGLVVALHLPSLLHAATPPLGMTAHLLVALGLAGVGGGIGLIAGNAVRSRLVTVEIEAEPEVEMTRSRRFGAGADPAPAPETATDGRIAPRVRAGDAHPDAPPRRPLVVTEDVLPFSSAITAPGVHPETGVADFSITPVSEAAPQSVEFVPVPEVAEAAPEHEPEADLPPFIAAALQVARGGEGERPPTVDFIAATPEPVEAAPVVEPEPVVEAAPEPAAERAPAPLAHVAAAAPNPALTEAPLESLGLVQLIERLALAIAARQERRAQATALLSHAAAEVAQAPLHRFDPLTMEPEGPLLRAKPARLDVAAPVLDDPLAGQDEHDDAEFAHDLPPRFLGGAVAAQGLDANEDHEDHENPVDERYSSLADMRLSRPDLAPSPAPVLAFPHAAVPVSGSGEQPADATADADQALRDALATLRQMSGLR